MTPAASGPCTGRRRTDLSRHLLQGRPARLVAGDGGTILSTDDGGKTWQERLDAKKQHFTTEHLLDIDGVGDQVWASGFDGTLLHSTDFGRTWEKQVSGTTMALQGIYFLDANHGWAVGWSGTIMRTVDGGKKWSAITSDAATWSLYRRLFPQ